MHGPYGYNGLGRAGITGEKKWKNIQVLLYEYKMFDYQIFMYIFKLKSQGDQVMPLC